MFRILLTSSVLGLTWCQSAFAADAQVESLIQTICQVGPKGAGHVAAVEAQRELSRVDVAHLIDVLTGMRGADKLSRNWLRAAVESIVSRHTQAGGQLPVQELEAFLVDLDNDAHARRLAYELIYSADPTAEPRLIPQFINDPSLELRRDAVRLALDEAEQLEKQGLRDKAIVSFRRALNGARDEAQIKSAAESLRRLGQKVDVASHFGFIQQWHIAGPFDNTDTQGFDVAYPPEDKVQLDAVMPGKNGDVSWKHYTTDDEYGLVDLTKALDKHKGAIAYAFTEFVAAEPRQVELRLGCINANKIWLNGKLLTANNVYHAGSYIDQYVTAGQLQKGKNQILLKIAQNEQEEPWAQRWEFQFRVCDEFGTAVLSQDRPLAQTARLFRTPTR